MRLVPRDVDGQPADLDKYYSKLMGYVPETLDVGVGLRLRRPEVSLEVD